MIASTLFILLFGVIEAARFVSAREVLDKAVGQAVRFAATHGAKSATPASTADITRVLQSATAPMLNGSSVTVSVAYTPDNNPGSSVKVTASYTWAPITKLLPVRSTVLQAQAVLTILN